MSDIWIQIGFIRYPLFFSCLAIFVLGAYSSARLFRSGAVADRMTKTWLDAVLFWGGFAMITGVLGTLVGIVITAESIGMAGSVSTALVWGGIKVALLSSALGALILGASALVWFALQLRWRVLDSQEMPGA